MRKTIMRLFGASLIAAASVQMASAAQQRHTRPAAEMSVSERARNSNAYAIPAESEWARYSGGALSAPAGR
jgi:hypothetical protein